MNLKRWVNIRSSINSDGLGVPTISIFLSGCDRKDKKGNYCEGCHNFEIKDDGNGFYLTIDEVEKIINEKINNSIKLFGNCELAIIGGEPLSELNRGFSIELAKRINSKNIIYTWREIEDIKNENIDISNFDRIVCGSYDRDLASKDYVLGSNNQYCINNEFKKILKYEGDEKCI